MMGRLPSVRDEKDGTRMVSVHLSTLVTLRIRKRSTGDQGRVWPDPRSPKRDVSQTPCQTQRTSFPSLQIVSIGPFPTSCLVFPHPAWAPNGNSCPLLFPFLLFYLKMIHFGPSLRFSRNVITFLCLGSHTSADRQSGGRNDHGA